MPLCPTPVGIGEGITTPVNEEGHLYGSVGPAQIVAALAEQSCFVDAQNVVLDEPIRKLDKYTVTLKFAEVDPAVTAGGRPFSIIVEGVTETVAFDIVQDEDLLRPRRQRCDGLLQVEREAWDREGMHIAVGDGVHVLDPLVVPVPPPPLGLAIVQDHVHREAVEPGAEERVAEEGAELLPCPHEHVRDLAASIHLGLPTRRSDPRRGPGWKHEREEQSIQETKTCAWTPYGQAMYRLLDQAVPQQLEEVLADFIAPASGEAAAPIDERPAAAPRPPSLGWPQLPSEPLATVFPQPPA